MVAGRDLAAVRAPYRVDVEGVGPLPASGDALLDGGHDVAEERQVSPVEEKIPIFRNKFLQFPFPPDFTQGQGSKLDRRIWYLIQRQNNGCCV